MAKTITSTAHSKEMKVRSNGIYGIIFAAAGRGGMLCSFLKKSWGSTMVFTAANLLKFPLKYLCPQDSSLLELITTRRVRVRQYVHVRVRVSFPILHRVGLD